jgi:peptide/nickel transport system substrate-binding protein
VLNGNGTPAYSVIPSASPAYDLLIPAGVELYDYQPEKAMALLDQAGWTDTNGDGVRDKDGVEMKLRYFDRSVGDGTATTGFITDWLKDVGIATEVQTFDEDSLTALQGKGEYDLFTWGWVGFVDPDTELSYFTSANVATNPDDGGYNDANWCNAEYDALYERQKIELDPTKRAALIQQALLVFYEDAPYAVLYKADERQAIRSDRWENFANQPAGTGPLLFTNTSPAYLQLRPVGTPSGDGDSNTGLIVGGVGVGVLALVGIGFWMKSRRNQNDDDRE